MMLFAGKAFLLYSIIYSVLFRIAFRDAFASPPKAEASKDLGCWQYTGGGVLKDGVRAESEKAITPLICANSCAKLNFSYALLKYGKECLCRGSMSKMDQTAAFLCDFPCAGDSSSMCGGFHEKYTALHTGYFLKSEFTRFWDHINQSYVGCFMERGPFCKDSFSDDEMSVGMCLLGCYKRKKILAAIKNAEECCCSSTMEGTEAGNPSGCWRFCDDNPAFRCGAVLPWVAIYDIEKVPKDVLEPTLKPPPQTIEQMIENKLPLAFYVALCILAIVVMLATACCVCRSLQASSRSADYRRMTRDTVEYRKTTRNTVES